MLDKVKRHADHIALVSLLVAVFSFLYCTGTITSGYHFTDDHQMISISGALEKNSFLKTTAESIKKDFNIRFRPIFYLYFVSIIKVFGPNFVGLSIFVGALSSLSVSFFYLGLRKLKHSVLASLLFVLLIFLGSQTAIWWRLGTNETIGVFFLGLSFLFMTKCLDKSNYTRNNILFVIFLVVTSLCKESFIMVIPAFIIFKIWNEKRAFEATWKESLKRNIWLTIPLVVMVIELLVIKFVVGTNQIGYAGLTSSSAEFGDGIKNIVFGPESLLSWMRLSGVLLLLYLASFIFVFDKRKEELLRSLSFLSIYIGFALLIVLPEIFMHAKSGMVERYLLPTTFGLAFWVVGIIKSTRQNAFKAAIVLVVVAFAWSSFNVAKTSAFNFVSEGNETNLFLSNVKKLARPESKMLLVADPVDRFEDSWSIKIYLSYYGLNNLYAYPMFREYRNDFEKGLRDRWLKWFDGKRLENIKGDPDLIIVFDKAQSFNFFDQSGLLKSSYEESILPGQNNRMLYIKK